MDVILIRPVQLQRELEMRQGRLLDIRSQEEYQKEHIKGAWNVPADQLETYIRRQSRQKFFVLYCERGIMSLRMGRKLAREGFYIGALAGGWNGYHEHERNHIDSSKRNLYDNNIWK